MATEKDDPQNIAREPDDDPLAELRAATERAAEEAQATYEEMKANAEALPPPPSPEEVAGPEPTNEPSPEPTTDDVEEPEQINEHNDDPKKTYDDHVVEETAAVSRMGSTKPLEIHEIDNETHAPVELERVVDPPVEEE